MAGILLTSHELNKRITVFQLNLFGATPVKKSTHASVYDSSPSKLSTVWFWGVVFYFTLSEWQLNLWLHLYDVFRALRNECWNVLNIIFVLHVCSSKWVWLQVEEAVFTQSHLIGFNWLFSGMLINDLSHPSHGKSKLCIVCNFQFFWGRFTSHPRRFFSPD